MTKQEAIKILERDCPKRPQKLWSVKRTEAIHMAIEALKIRTDGDTISRQDAIDACKHAWAKGLEPSQYVEILPSAQPLTKTDLLELEHRFGEFVRFVVEDMLSGEEKRWEKKI